MSAVGTRWRTPGGSLPARVDCEAGLLLSNNERTGASLESPILGVLIVSSNVSDVPGSVIFTWTLRGAWLIVKSPTCLTSSCSVLTEAREVTDSVILLFATGTVVVDVALEVVLTKDVDVSSSLLVAVGLSTDGGGISSSVFISNFLGGMGFGVGSTVNTTGVSFEEIR